jgi:hypothetical protein
LQLGYATLSGVDWVGIINAIKNTSTAAPLLLNPSGGYVGVGTTTPSYNFDVNGTIHYTTLTASSDERFKTNIEPISKALDTVMKLKPIKFEWNEYVNTRRGGYTLNKPTFGFIAQEVEKVLPELVTYWKLSDDCEDAQSLNYEKIIPILTAAIKELKAEFDAYKASHP